MEVIDAIILFVAHLCHCDNRAKRRREHRALLARIRRQRPPARPPYNNDLTKSSIITHPQTTSHFFTLLPPEIRQRIYAYVLGHNIVLLEHISRRIAHHHFPLPSLFNILDTDVDHDNDSDGGENDVGFSVPATPEIEWSSIENKAPNPGQFGTLPLSFLHTCHAICGEALPILYNSNIFSCNTPLPFVYLHDLSLPPSHFTLIRHLRLQWVNVVEPGVWAPEDHSRGDWDTWSRFCAIVARMQLITLGVEIRVLGYETDLHEDARWVQEIRPVSGGVKALSVRVLWINMNLARRPDLEAIIRRRWQGAS